MPLHFWALFVTGSLSLALCVSGSASVALCVSGSVSLALCHRTVWAVQVIIGMVRTLETAHISSLATQLTQSACRSSKLGLLAVFKAFALHKADLLAPALEPLMTNLASPDPQLSWAVRDVLVSMGSKLATEQVATVASCLSNGTTHVRFAAASVLGELGPEAAAAHLPAMVCMLSRDCVLQRVTQGGSEPADFSCTYALDIDASSAVDTNHQFLVDNYDSDSDRFVRGLEQRSVNDRNLFTETSRDDLVYEGDFGPNFGTGNFGTNDDYDISGRREYESDCGDYSQGEDMYGNYNDQEDEDSDKTHSDY